MSEKLFKILYVYVMQKIENKKSETHTAVLSGSGAASGHFEKYSVAVTLYLLP